MKYLLIYFIVPAVVSFLVQSILCRKVKKGVLRHGALLFPVISGACGAVILFTQCGGVFGGLGALGAVSWFAGACCTVLGYGAAWLVFRMAGKNREQGERDSL